MKFPILTHKRLAGVTLLVSAGVFVIWCLLITRCDDRSWAARIEGSFTVAAAVAAIFTVAFFLFPERKRINVTALYRSGSPLNREIFDGLRNRLGSLGIKFTSHEVAPNGTHVQQHEEIVAEIEKFSKNIDEDLLVTRPVFTNLTLESALKHCFESKKHIVFIDSVVSLPTSLQEHSRLCCFVYSDNEAGGRDLGRFVNSDFQTRKSADATIEFFAILTRGPDVVNLGAIRSDALFRELTSIEGNDALVSEVVIKSWDRDHVGDAVIKRLKKMSEPGGGHIRRNTAVYLFVGADAMIPGVVRRIREEFPHNFPWRQLTLLGYDGIKLPGGQFSAFDHEFNAATIDIAIDKYVDSIVSAVRDFDDKGIFARTNYVSSGVLRRKGS